MIIDYLDVVDVAPVPNKADSPPVIDSDIILTVTVSLEGFQTVSRRNAQIIEGSRLVEHAQFAQGASLNFRRQFSRWFPIKEALSVFIPEHFILKIIFKG
jgi:hypothetical protein